MTVYSVKMKQAIRNYLERYAPTSLAAVRAVRGRWQGHRRHGDVQRNVRAVLYANRDVTVLRGPFAGMRYLDEPVWGLVTSRWLGCYEIELAAIIAEIVEGAYDVVVDVGCAEGYFLTGIPYRTKSRTKAYGYDTDFISRWQARRMARLNGLSSRITVGGWCNHDNLARHAAEGKVALICDIEGGERELLQPSACPALKQIDVLVEVHENLQGTHTEQMLISRFSESHSIQVIRYNPDRSAWIDCADLDAPKELLRAAAAEWRSDGCTWLWMKSKLRR